MIDSKNKTFYEFMETIENLSKDKPKNYISEEMIKDFETKENNIQKDNIVQFTQTKSIKKSVNNTKHKKKELKISTKKIDKKIIILLIATIIGLSALPKAVTHYQTEQIKKESIEEFYNEVEEMGLNPNKITVEGIINNSTPEYIKENLFELFQIINKTYKPNEASKVFDLMIQKGGLGNSFDEYLLEQGYFVNIESKRIPSITKWENDMEAQKLAEKESVRGVR